MWYRSSARIVEKPKQICVSTTSGWLKDLTQDKNKKPHRIISLTFWNLAAWYCFQQNIFLFLTTDPTIDPTNKIYTLLISFEIRLTKENALYFNKVWLIWTSFHSVISFLPFRVARCFTCHGVDSLELILWGVTWMKTDKKSKTFMSRTSP